MKNHKWDTVHIEDKGVYIRILFHCSRCDEYSDISIHKEDHAPDNETISKHHCEPDCDLAMTIKILRS